MSPWQNFLGEKVCFFELLYFFSSSLFLRNKVLYGMGDKVYDSRDRRVGSKVLLSSGANIYSCGGKCFFINDRGHTKVIDIQASSLKLLTTVYIESA